MLLETKAQIGVTEKCRGVGVSSPPNNGRNFGEVICFAAMTPGASGVARLAVSR